jgi:Cu/Ag efflux pump CusA
MTGWLLATGVRFRALMLGIAAIVAVGAVVQLHRMAVDVVPEFLPPTVQIQTDALGLSAEEVEQLITVPMEQDLLNGMPWLSEIRSDSMPGLSSIEMVFQRGTDMLKARQVVQERLLQAHALPAVGTPPVMVQPLSSTSRVAMVGLSSSRVSAIDMSVLARWKIRPRLMGLPGVANVAIWGQRDRQLQVQIDPQRLRSYGVTVDQIVTSTGNAMWVSPLTFLEASTPGTGGFIDTPNQRFSIQHILPIATAGSLASVTLEGTRGHLVRLGDVAQVTEDHQPLIGDAVLRGGPALVMVVEKLPGANTRAVTHEVETALKDMAPGLTGIRIDTGLYRPASYLDSALRNIGIVALKAVLLAALMLGLLLWSWRAAAVLLVTAPLALLSATYVLYLAGATFNAMVVIGFTVALGVVIDDIVVGVYRRRAETSPDAAAGLVADEAVAAAARVRPVLFYAVVGSALVTLPLLLLPGVAGAFARAGVAAYVVAMLTSLIVSLTVAPALTALLGLRPIRPLPLPARWAAVTRRVMTSAGNLVTSPGRLVLPVLVLAVAAGTSMALLPKGSALPAARDPNVLVRWTAAPGTSLPELDRITARAQHSFAAIPGVAQVGSDVGRALTSDRVVNVDAAETWITIAKHADYDATLAAIKSTAASYPGLGHRVDTYPSERVAAEESTTGAPLTIRVYGKELPQLATIAQQVRQRIAGVAGVAAPIVHLPTYSPTMEVRVDLAAAHRYGIKPGDVRRATSTVLSGLLVGNLYQDQAVFDVVVLGTPQLRNNPSAVADMVIDTPTRGHVRLGDVASVQIRPDPVDIQHYGVSRTIEVTADVRGRSLPNVLHDVRAQVGSLAMPLEYHAEVVSSRLTQQNGVRHTWAVTAAVIVALLLLVQVSLGSWRLAFAVTLALPLAAVGSALVAPLAGGTHTVAVAAGIAAVLSLALRNMLVLLRDLKQGEVERAGDGNARVDTVLRVTQEHVTPVVTTALVTAAALTSVFIVGSHAGTEVLAPLALVILGGLVTATLLTLLVAPALYLLVAAPRNDTGGTS